MKTIDQTTAAVTLIGAVIHQAIVDCFSPDKDLRNEAHDFVFGPRIVDYVNKFHIDNFINVDYIRDKVKEGKKACLLYGDNNENLDESN